MVGNVNQEELMKSHVMHNLPGRLRLAASGLKYLKEQSGEIAAELARLPGVRLARVTACTGGILLQYDSNMLDAHELAEQVDLVLARHAMTALRTRHSENNEAPAEAPMTTARLAKRLAVNAGALVLGNTLFPAPLLGGALANFSSLEALASLGLSAPMAKSAWEGLRREHRPNADFLTVTSIVASLLLGNAHSALMILALSDLAELMTSYTIERTRSSIKKMLSADEGEAWKVMPDGKLERRPMNQIHAGDTIAVHTGEKISVDGKVVSGAAVVDQSPITGEFVPVEKREGDEVFAGTVVKSGNLRVQAAKVGDQTVISRIVGMVEASELKKAPIQRYADKFSNYLVPLNFLLCLSVWLVTRNPQKALKMLVIDYSCGIKLSTATAFSAAINTAVRQGVLIKGGTFIEQMSRANTVLLDKTGTITEGKPRIVSAVLLKDDMTLKDVLSYAMAAEETSTHPLAGAIMRYGRQLGAEPLAHADVVTEVSRGSRTRVGEKTVRVGNLEYMKENGASAASPLPADTGMIPNYVSVDREIIAVLYAMDSPRENVRRAINSLRYDGVGDIELLTGDMESQARVVAEQVGADSYRAQLLPEQKAEAVLKLQVQGNGVVMVGDGINDAPALAYADVGISMGSKSTDIAMETSDVIINRDDPMMIPELRRLARATMRIVHQNFALVIAINSVGLILGAASGISVMMSALLHNSSTILVVANSLRLMFMKPGDGRH
ncbi:MAG: heavy metal translocating P-type ATPase [Clostridia bacterium]|nr:heavy metal translocating P-type ATPase [Clostridia bacterium]